MQIDEQTITNAVVERISANIEFEVNEQIKLHIDKEINIQLATVINKLLEEKAREVFVAGLETSFTPADNFGRPAGTPTTIAKALTKLTQNYWATWVDKNGKPTDSTYNRITRAEYFMLQICAEDFTEQMKHSLVQVTAELKDGLRAQLGKHVDGLLDSLFKVKSLQDQGKAKKPY